MSQDTRNPSRREFIRLSTVAMAGLSSAGAIAPPPVFAAGNDKIRVGVIGCGNRGGGAAINCLDADPAVEIVAVADPLRDRVDAFLPKLQAWNDKQTGTSGQRVRITPEATFIGFDGYRRLLAMDALDLVLITSPVAFHPLHLEACVQAGKHVFLEKPAAVDPVGARRVIAAGELAKTKGLAVGSGTQRRHQDIYLRNQRAVADGAIGKIVAGRIWWCGGNARLVMERVEGEDDAHLMVRNWYQYTEMCGDHIVEQHVHNIDVANWFIGRPPEFAMGFGGRARRELGNRYDFFSVDFDYGNDVTVHSMARQIPGCYNRIGEQFIGTEGSVWPGGKIAGKKSNRPEAKESTDPYVQEHVDLIRSIRDGKPLNEARSLAEATLTAIMGRISAYTGEIVRWIDLTERTESPWYGLTLKPGPEDFEAGKIALPPAGIITLPGKIG